MTNVEQNPCKIEVLKHLFNLNAVFGFLSVVFMHHVEIVVMKMISEEQFVFHVNTVSIITHEDSDFATSRVTRTSDNTFVFLMDETILDEDHEQSYIVRVIGEHLVLGDRLESFDDKLL